MKVKEALRRIVILVGLLAPSMASADVIYQTSDPFGGPFGLWGADVFQRQSVALRITPTGRYTLDSIGLWFMNNDFSGMHHDTVILTLRDDAVSSSGGSIPSDTIHENWAFPITATGWDPRLETVASVLHPTLEPGVNYWIVAESAAPPFTDPVWNFASMGTNFVAYTRSDTMEWQDGGELAAITAIVQGTPRP